jgi:uncharacterized protein (DUF885 family)
MQSAHFTTTVQSPQVENEIGGIWAMQGTGKPTNLPRCKQKERDMKLERRDFILGSGSSALAAGLTGLPAVVLAAGKPPRTRDAALSTLLDQLFYKELAISPESLSQLGLDKGARAAMRSKLDDRSIAGKARNDRLEREALAALRAFSEVGLSEQGKLHRDIAIYQYERYVAAQKLGVQSVQTPYPITQQGGAYFDIPDFLDSVHPVENAADAEAYLVRLAAFPTALDQDSTFQRAEAARGMVAPAWSLDLAIGQLRQLRAPAAESSSMVTSLAGRAKAKGIAGDFTARAAKIIAGQVYPAVDRQIALLERLRGTTPVGDGFWRLPKGDELYAEALRSATTTDMTPEQVHKVGLEQVADISARLDVILKTAGLTTGSVGERLTALNTRPEQLYADTDAGRKELLDSLNTGIAAMWDRLPRAFNDVPKLPLEIRRVPPEIQDGASNGYYSRASLDGSRNAIYWINMKSTGDWPKYQLPSLTYHEGLPGHHLQLSYVHKAGGELPMMLRNLFISAYGEGWALYSEQLADELGAYSGIEAAGYLQSFLFRSARLVVDTGIHHMRWSREQATDYLVSTTGFTRGRSQREAERYCTMGGQACSYKIGHNKWVELRQRAQAALGDKFSLPWFHDVLKEGIMPLALLEKRVDARIAARVRGGRREVGPESTTMQSFVR